MDINKNQQTNTFHKGMDTDTSDVLLGSDQYRYAQNLRITVDGSGSNGELHTIKGTEPFNTEFETGEQVLAFSTIRNLCVAILYKKYKENEQDEEYKRVWRIVKWNPEEENSFVTVFGPSSKKIWDGDDPTLKTLSTVLRWESEKNVKYYIATGVTEIMSINIGEQDSYPFAVDTENPNADITIDNVYDNAFQYQGDGLPLMTVEISNRSGSLKPAMVQYAYRLYIQNGAASDMSPLTKPIYLVKNDHEGYAQVDTTSRAIDISFPQTQITGNLYIQIYRINYQQNGQLPVVDIIADQPFVSEFDITDTGQSVQSVSAAEFLSELDTHIIPKMIESKGDILYAANIKDGMSETMELFTNFDARSYSTGNMYNGNLIFTKTNGAYTQPNSFDNIEQNGLTHRQFTGNGIATWDNDYWDKIITGGGNVHMDSMTFSREMIADSLENDDAVYIRIVNPRETEKETLEQEISALRLQIGVLRAFSSTSSSSDPDPQQLEELQTLETTLQTKEDDLGQLKRYELFLIQTNYSYLDGSNRVSNSVISYSLLSSGDNITPTIKAEESSIPETTDVIVESYTIIPYDDFLAQNQSTVYDYYLGTDEVYYNGIGKYIKWRYVVDDNDNPKYRAGEVYRFGIVLYDEHGKAAPVKWIADIMIPDYYNPNGGEDNLYYNYHVGIEFYVDIPKQLKCSAYDIVRCDRDFSSRYSMFQGIVGFTTCSDTSDSTCFNPGFFTLDTVLTTHTAIVSYKTHRSVGTEQETTTTYISNKWWTGSCKSEDRYKPFKVKRDLLMFACPEYCYNHTQVTDLLNSRSDFELQIIDRRDVSCISGQSKIDENLTGFLDEQENYLSNDYSVNVKSSVILSSVYLRDDARYWVHSPALNILDNHPNSLNYAGLGFKIGTVGEDSNGRLDLTADNDLQNNDKFLELNAGFVALQSRSDAYSDFDATVDTQIDEGTWDPHVPQAWREQYDSTANRVCTFFNWFGYWGPNTDRDNENNWHIYSSTVLKEQNGVKYHSVSYPIKNIAYVDARQYDQFVEGKSNTDFNIKAFDQTTAIQLGGSNVNFINWSLGSLNKEWIEDSNDREHKSRIELTWNVSGDVNKYFQYKVPGGNDRYVGEEWVTLDSTIQWYPIGGGDDLLLLSLNEEATRYTLNDLDFNTINGMSPRIYVANIKKPCVPYGGYNDASIKSSKFYSFGNYVSVKDALSHSSDNDECVHTSIKISGGDTFVTHFKYNALHWWNNAVYNKQVSKMCTIYDTVLETDVNIDAQYGYLYRTGRGYSDGEYKIQHNAVDGVTGGYSQNKNSYMYNSGYSCRPNLIPKTPDNKTAGETDTYDTRIHYSNRKTNNESIDSWVDFKSNNFLDVDTRFGEITDLKLFKDKLMFWQNNAAGIISTNERTILQSTDDASIILGDGSVLQRFDYISQIYGQKPNQYTSCATNSNLYWWDEYRKEILHYVEGYNVVPLSTVKMVKNYISERTPVSVPTISYDVDNNEVICHVVTDDKVANQSLVFNEAVQAFTAVYTFAPVFYGLCMYDQYMIGGDNEVYKYNVPQHQVTLFRQEAMPKVKFVVNAASDFTKTFDIQTFGGKFYGGGGQAEIDIPNEVYDTHRTTDALSPLTFSYNTPLKQHASINGREAVTNAEYDFRLAIPRNGQDVDPQVNSFIAKEQWGNRLRGKLMQVELSSNSNSSDFALHYITTKYRISWN